MLSFIEHRIIYLRMISSHRGMSSGRVPVILKILESGVKIFEVLIPTTQTLDLGNDMERWSQENCPSFFDMSYEYIEGSNQIAYAAYRFTDLSESVEFKLRWL